LSLELAVLEEGRGCVTAALWEGVMLLPDLPGCCA
jgi:hypothetical protein